MRIAYKIYVQEALELHGHTLVPAAEDKIICDKLGFERQFEDKAERKLQDMISWRKRGTTLYSLGASRVSQESNHASIKEWVMSGKDELKAQGYWLVNSRTGKEWGRESDKSYSNPYTQLIQTRFDNLMKGDDNVG